MASPKVPPISTSPVGLYECCYDFSFYHECSRIWTSVLMLVQSKHLLTGWPFSQALHIKTLIFNVFWIKSQLICGTRKEKREPLCSCFSTRIRRAIRKGMAKCRRKPFVTSKYLLDPGRIIIVEHSDGDLEDKWVCANCTWIEALYQWLTRRATRGNDGTC